MNLSILERMIGEGDLSRDAFRYLLECRSECEWLDYKEQLALEEDSQLCAFAKDVLALKNVGGGYILVGVRDKTWEQVGVAGAFPYDAKLVRDKVVRATGLNLDIDVVTHELRHDSGALRFALLLVRGAKKRSKRRKPAVAAKDFCLGKPFEIRRGDIYIRRGDSTARLSSSEELIDLLDRLEEQADEDARTAEGTPSPFAVSEGTYRLLERGFESFVGREDLRNRVVSAVCGDPRLWIINVHGPGGVGKSALVNWVAYELYKKRQFEAILQLTAKETVLTDAGINRYSRSLYSLENLLDQILLLFEENPDRPLVEKRSLAIELLSAWKTLLILDNMETISDGRILSFVQSLPESCLARVVLTSRTRSPGWELSIAVNEMSREEAAEFIKLRSRELDIDFPLDAQTIQRVYAASGGLPLAVQWMIGHYKRSRRIDLAVARVLDRDSPVLEFSFRNIWQLLSRNARTVLALLTIFDGPPTAQQISVAADMGQEAVEQALGELVDMTLVNRVVSSEGQATYLALPITLSFSRHQLGEMGELELRSRQRWQQFNEQLELQYSEVARFRGEFEKYGIETPNEKRAAILCRRAESEMFAGNAEGAEVLFSQARDMAPQSAYVLSRSASYELARNRVGVALERATEACARATKRTGALAFSVKARILDVQRDRGARLEALEKALSFDPEDMVLRHQYGVALSRVGLEAEAIKEFTRIIDVEKTRIPPRDTLVMAYNTRIINLRRLNRAEEANADIERVRALVTEHPSLRAIAARLLE
jgi:tetratricopeptide (TPR) repeat protein